MAKNFGIPRLSLEYNKKSYPCSLIVRHLEKYFPKNSNSTLNDIIVLTDEEQQYKLCLLSNGYLTFSSFSNNYIKQINILKNSYSNGKYTYNDIEIYPEIIYLGRERITYHSVDNDTRYRDYYKHNVCGSIVNSIDFSSCNSKNYSDHVFCKKCNWIREIGSGTYFNVKMVHPVLTEIDDVIAEKTIN